MANPMKLSWLAVLANSGARVASMRVRDPSDAIPPAMWTADNALFADYTVPTVSMQSRDVQADYTFNTTADVTPTDRLYVSRKNDTSVILLRDGARVHFNNVEVRKAGYSSNAAAAAAYGLNSAVNVANGSTGFLNHVNVTSHNGAANLYVSGTGSRLNVDNAWLYSSGPAAPAILASGNAIAMASHVKAFSGGQHSSAFAGEEPGGAVNISSSIARTIGLGSACFNAVGQIYADNVACETEQAPTLLMDGASLANIHATTAIAGRLAAVVLFNSGARSEGAFVSLSSVDLTTTGADMPALWFGNTVATANLDQVEVNTFSRMLVVANRSVVTPDFDHFTGASAGNATVSPAVANVYVTNSRLVGDVVALRGSTVNLFLGEGSSLTGTVRTDGGNSTVNVQIRGTAQWTMTNNAEVATLRTERPLTENVVTNGHNLHVVHDLSKRD